MTEPNAYGMFVSRWQGQVSMAKARAAGLTYVYIRATVGDYYTDPRYYENVRRAEDAGLYWSPVHNVKGAIDVKRQLERFWSVTATDRPTMPTVLDAEDMHKLLWFKTLDMARALVNSGEKLMPFVYTAQWVEGHSPGKAHTDLGSFGLSVADYRPNPAPALPSAWSDWKDWQYSADKNGRGDEFGCESPDISLHRWFSTVAHLREHIQADKPTDPPNVSLPADLTMLDIALLLSKQNG